MSKSSAFTAEKVLELLKSGDHYALMRLAQEHLYTQELVAVSGGKAVNVKRKASAIKRYLKKTEKHFADSLYPKEWIIPLGQEFSLPGQYWLCDNVSFVGLDHWPNCIPELEVNTEVLEKRHDQLTKVIRGNYNSIINCNEWHDLTPKIIASLVTREEISFGFEDRAFDCKRLSTIIAMLGTENILYYSDDKEMLILRTNTQSACLMGKRLK